MPPLPTATVVALACALPADRGEPLARYSTGEWARLIAAHPAAPPLSRSTIRRIRDRHALKPWRYRSWLFPRDPQCAEKAGRVLDLYAGVWEGHPLGPDDCVLSADEKTSSQARQRRHPSAPPGPGAGQRVEHESARGGALAYLAAWDVRAGGVSGRCAATTGKAAFGRLVDQVMTQAPSRSARRVFGIVDNGRRPRGAVAAAEVVARHPTVIIVHWPPHASWLNQIEISFSIIQRKVLTPNDFADLAAGEARLLACEQLDNDTAVPFNWRFTRAELEARLAELPVDRPTEPALAEAA